MSLVGNPLSYIHWSHEMKFPKTNRRTVVGGITAALLALVSGVVTAQADKRPPTFTGH